MRRIVAVLLVIVLSACSAEPGGDTAIVGELQAAVLPDQSPAQLQARYGPLIDYLVSSTGLDLTLVVPSNYEHMLNQFKSGDLHLALLGGLTFTQAELVSAAEPLAMRDVDLTFSSCYLVRDGDTRQSIEEYAGEPIGFGPRLSTSGHLMPRYFLGERGLIAEDFFSSLRHSRGHDQTAMWVADGTVAIGALNCVILRSMFADGRLAEGDVRVLDTTPTYVNYVWAVQPDLDEDIKTLLRNAFLALDPTVPEQLAILNAVGAGGYLPAGREDFDDVRAAVAATASLDNNTGQ